MTRCVMTCVLSVMILNFLPLLAKDETRSAATAPFTAQHQQRHIGDTFDPVPRCSHRDRPVRQLHLPLKYTSWYTEYSAKRVPDFRMALFD